MFKMYGISSNHLIKLYLYIVFSNPDKIYTIFLRKLCQNFSQNVTRYCMPYLLGKYLSELENDVIQEGDSLLPTLLVCPRC